MSIGVVALAFVPLLGLIPASLRVFRESMDTAIGSQIAQKIINEAIQTDFNTLISEGDGTTNQTFRAKNPDVSETEQRYWRYFDEQGNELSPHDSPRAVYHVLTRIAPKAPLPSVGPNQDLDYLAQVTVQVVTNPGNAEIPIVAQPEGTSARQGTPLRNLVDPAGRFPTYTAVALVPRNE